MLRDELDIEPETETLELREQIVGGAGKPRAKTAVATAKPAEPPASNDHRIAVLPFDNLSGDPEQEYFSDGITDSIILNLSLFPELQVKSRNSSFAFKQQIKSLGEISTELNVDYVVEGSIRKSPNRIRITVQLIEAISGNQVWGKRYDADIENLFDLEEKLSRTVAATVTGQIESDLQRIALAKGAVGQQSYDLLLSGIYHSYRFNRRDNVIAIEKLNQCLAQDPDNVRAHVYLYVCHAMDYLGRWSVDYQASFDLAKAYIDRALQLGPELGLVQTYYAEYLSFCGKTDEAGRHLDKAFEINPNDTDALAIRANCLALQGDFAASLQIAEQVCLMDPYHPWAEWELASGQYHSGCYENAIETIARYRTDPGFVWIVAIACHVKLGHIDAARRALQDFLQACREEMLSMPQSSHDWLQYVRATYPFDNVQYSRDLVECLAQAGLDEYLETPATQNAETSHNIAVLPFDNLSGDPTQEYFSDGISESIILHLNLFPELTVKSRNSSFAFKQQIKGLGEISAELGVDYLVEGSVRKSSEQIRITVQLVEAASGNQVWGKRYDAPLDDLFSLEEELSRSIAATVTGQIESNLQRIALAKGAADQRAYDLLLAGIYHAHRSNREDIAIAIDKLDQCLLLDPDNLRAHATIYQCHLLNWMDRLVEDCQASFELAGQHARKTLALDPDSGEAQYTYGEYLMFCHEHEQAGIHLDRALASNPSNPDYLTGKAMHHSMQGDFEAAIDVAERAYQLDPYNWWVDWNLAEAHFLCQRYQETLDTIARSINAPGFIRIYAVAANVKLGNLDLARKSLAEYLQTCRESMRAMPQTLDDWLQYTVDTAPFADPQINQDIIDCLVQAGLKEELAPGPPSTAEGRLPMVLVLPFDNLSGDPEQDYFSDGITESVILNLSSFGGLRVKSRHASFVFKDSARSIEDIAAELGVDYVVEGSIRKYADKVRITVQLGDAQKDNQLWGRRFDSELENLLDLEQELSRTIAGTVIGRIDRDTRQAALRKPAKDLRSYDYFMRGSYHIERFTAQDIGIAIEQFEKCLALDPDNAQAYATLGMAHMIASVENISEDRSLSLDTAHRCLTRALDLDPDDAASHACMAEYQMYRKNFDLAQTHAKKSIELNPTLADGYSILAWHAGATRQFDRATEYAQRSMQIDQFHPYVGWNAGEVYRVTGNYLQAIETFRSMAHMSPSVHAQIAACFAGLGRRDEAMTEMRQFLELARAQMHRLPVSEDDWRRLWEETMPYLEPADLNRFFELLLQAGLCDQIFDQGEDIPSIAVLPFENMSGDPEQEYFSDGITSSLILSLGLFNGLNVKSQGSSFAFKHSAISSKDIAEELSADFLVEGSIRKSGNKVRLAVQLVEAETDTQIWGKQYDAELADILDLEQELSATIAATISGRIGHRLQQSAVRKPANSLKSYDYLMRGLYHMGKFTAADMKIAQQQIEKCIELEPDNAEAHMQLGLVHSLTFLENWVEDRQQAMNFSGEHLNRALEIAPDNAQIQAYYGEYLLFRRDYERAEFHTDKAIELNPTAAEGYTMKAQVLGFTRRYEEALELADLCFRLDPNAAGTGWIAGEVYRATGDYDKAIKTFRSIQHTPTTIHAALAACLAALGQAEQAQSEMRLFQQRSRAEMHCYPNTRAAWRQFWKEVAPFKHEQDFEDLFAQLLQAGLCDDT